MKKSQLKEIIKQTLKEDKEDPNNEILDIIADQISRYKSQLIKGSITSMELATEIFSSLKYNKFNFTKNK